MHVFNNTLQTCWSVLHDWQVSHGSTWSLKGNWCNCTGGAILHAGHPMYMYVHTCAVQYSYSAQHGRPPNVLVCIVNYTIGSLPTYLHPSIHTSIHPFIHTCIHPYIQTDRHTDIQTDKHTYIHRLPFISIASVSLHNVTLMPSNVWWCITVICNAVMHAMPHTSVELTLPMTNCLSMVYAPNILCTASKKEMVNDQVLACPNHQVHS